MDVYTVVPRQVCPTQSIQALYMFTVSEVRRRAAQISGFEWSIHT